MKVLSGIFYFDLNLLFIVTCSSRLGVTKRSCATLNLIVEQYLTSLCRYVDVDCRGVVQLGGQLLGSPW